MSRIRGRRPSAALIVAVIALVAALGGGAVAGVTISKLNKKEKKQVKRLSKKQARKLDRRIELTPGPKGEQGLPGPTYAATKQRFVTDPPGNPDGYTVGSFDFSLPTAGAAYLRFNHPGLGQDCDGGGPKFGLYVDDEPIPDTSVVTPQASATRQVEIVNTVDLAGGDHTATVVGDCPDGTLGGPLAEKSGAPNWTVILLGGSP